MMRRDKTDQIDETDEIDSIDRPTRQTKQTKQTRQTSMSILTTLRSGHWPSLAGAWLHLTVSFMVWLLIGAMSIPLAQDLGLTDQETGLLIALPLLGGAVLRILAGWSADWIGARRTAVVLMAIEGAVLCWGWLGVATYPQALGFAVCLGVAGASFAVSLPIAGRAYPPAAQGLVLGLAASGNIGTVLVLFLAPRLANWLDWHQICAAMAALALGTLGVFVALVPAEIQRRQHDAGHWWHGAARLIRHRSAYWLCALYAVTFGGFVGLSSLLPMLLHDVYQFDAPSAGALAAFCGLVGSLIRPVGGLAADRCGGLQILHYVLPVIVGAVVAITSPSLSTAIAMMILATGAMGFGNGVVFQLVAEWFPKDIGLASGVVGAAGGLGGFLLPLAAATIKGFTGSYDAGLWLFAGLGVGAWGTVMLALRARSAASV
jgi:NNP family nitrate/nitrite transporter-like MFS transporter